VMAGALGVGFVMIAGKRVVVAVPHCAQHDDGATIAAGGPTGFVLLFRSHAYQQAFRELNRTAAVESPSTGRALGSWKPHDGPRAP